MMRDYRKKQRNGHPRDVGKKESQKNWKKEIRKAMNAKNLNENDWKDRRR